MTIWLSEVVVKLIIIYVNQLKVPTQVHLILFYNEICQDAKHSFYDNSFMSTQEKNWVFT